MESMQKGANKSQQQGGAQNLCKHGDLRTHSDAHIRCLEGNFLRSIGCTQQLQCRTLLADPASQLARNHGQPWYTYHVLKCASFW